MYAESRRVNGLKTKERNANEIEREEGRREEGVMCGRERGEAAESSGSASSSEQMCIDPKQDFHIIGLSEEVYMRGPSNERIDILLLR